MIWASAPGAVYQAWIDAMEHFHLDQGSSLLAVMYQYLLRASKDHAKVKREQYHSYMMLFSAIITYLSKGYTSSQDHIEERVMYGFSVYLPEIFWI